MAPRINLIYYVRRRSWVTRTLAAVRRWRQEQAGPSVSAHRSGPEPIVDRGHPEVLGEMEPPIAEALVRLAIASIDVLNGHLGLPLPRAIHEDLREAIAVLYGFLRCLGAPPQPVESIDVPSCEFSGEASREIAENLVSDVAALDSEWRESSSWVSGNCPSGVADEHRRWVGRVVALLSRILGGVEQAYPELRVHESYIAYGTIPFTRE